jgi:phospholipid/cholesterol/gamma-HCH transport system ATP-binding protein
LSGGMKKRAAIARAAALDPELLIFDEPSAGLDPIVAAELDELILFLKRLFEMTIVVVTHEMASAFRIADRIAFLYKGSLIAVEDKQAFQVNTDPRIRQFVDRVPSPIGESAAVQRRVRELAGIKEHQDEEH